MICTCFFCTCTTYPSTREICNIFITLIIIYIITTICWFYYTTCRRSDCTWWHPCITIWMIIITYILYCCTWSIYTTRTIPITLTSRGYYTIILMIIPWTPILYRYTTCMCCITINMAWWHPIITISFCICISNH